MIPNHCSVAVGVRFAQAPDARAALGVDVLRGSDASTRHPPPRILIVEDEYLLSMDMETALVGAGYEVAGNVKNAQAAVKVVSAERPLLAIMDIRLDGKHDGIDAALVLFRAYGVRCIFATGVTNPQARERAAPAAPLAWLQKPFSMNALISAVDDALAEIAKQD